MKVHCFDTAKGSQTIIINFLAYIFILIYKRENHGRKRSQFYEKFYQSTDHELKSNYKKWIATVSFLQVTKFNLVVKSTDHFKYTWNPFSWEV